MMLVDPRDGSEDLLLPLQRYGVPAEHAPCQMEAGDFAFVGRGINDEDVFVGVEMKETQDLISCVYSGRYTAEQVPKLQRIYGHHVWFLTEGIWREGNGGILEHYRSGQWKALRIGAKAIMCRDLESWILTQVIRGGFHYKHCSTRADTVRFLAVLYHWWTDKSLEEHRSHQAIYIAPPNRAMMKEPTEFHKMMSCLPKIGWEKGRVLAEYCDEDLDRLMLATEKELTELDGIGKTLALKIHRFLHPSHHSAAG